MALSRSTQGKLEASIGRGSAIEITTILDTLDELGAAEVAFLDGVSAGVVTASKALVVGSSSELDDLNVTTLTVTTMDGTPAFSGTPSFAGSPTFAGANLHTAGAAAAAVAQRFGATATEGLEIKVIDETVSGFTGAKTFDLTEDIPAGAVILSVQANIETTVVAGGTSVKVSVGVAGGDVDKYGKTADFSQNAKIDTLPDWAVLASAEDVEIGIVVTDGTTLGDTNASAGAVRVRIVYLQPNSLDNAA